MRRGLLVCSVLALLLCTFAPVYGQGGQSTQLMETAGSPYGPVPVSPPSGEDMIMDLLLVRPISFAALALGTGMAIFATPFTLASGTSGPVYEKLVVEPYYFLVCRPLGEF